MKNCKPLSIHVYKATILANNICPKDDNEINEIEKIPYTYVISSLMHIMTGLSLIKSYKNSLANCE